MAVNNRVEGLETVLANLNREINQIEGATRAGAMEAGLVVQRNAQQRAPVRTGNLKASAYTARTDTGAVVGFTAAYAPFVHEAVEANFRVGGAKFLEKALSANRGRILRIMQRRAKV